MHVNPIEKQYVLHTWTAQRDWQAPTIAGGEGAWFWDTAGKRYLDMSSQAECCNLGHQHPALLEAIQKQTQLLCYISNGWGAQPRALLAQKIVEIANDTGEGADRFGKVFFTCDGAEGIENAIKMARWMTGRSKIISRYRSYHGSTHGAMSVGADARGWNTPDGLNGVAHVLPPYCYRCPFGLTKPACELRCATHVEDVIQYEGPQHIAAIVAEPSAGTNGIIPPEGYWNKLHDIASRYGILLIADEVMSGFGRTGAWFAWQKAGAAPDMIVMAKGLTGAHVPLGAVCVSHEVAAYFDDKVLETGLTYSGHPLACAAGVAAIDAYKQGDLIERAKLLGGRLAAQLTDMQSRHSCIGDVRCDGLFGVIEMQENTFPKPLVWLKQAQKALLEHGISTAVRSNMMIVCPPLVIKEADFEWALDEIDHILPM